eukprot:scaffold394045_cov17-Prasinocladus_malaysianus.AAC.1
MIGCGQAAANAPAPKGEKGPDGKRGPPPEVEPAPPMPEHLQARATCPHPHRLPVCHRNR